MLFDRLLSVEFVCKLSRFYVTGKVYITLSYSRMITFYSSLIPG